MTTDTRTTTHTFTDRADAGRRLATLLSAVLDVRDDLVVIGLPRGGVPVAAEVAEALGAPLDVIVVRKLGVPFQEELAMGAIGEGGVVVLNDEVVAHAHVTAEEIGASVERARTPLIARAA
ncbi:MAG: phosphoribosyltransferase family protein, partial [Ilumatobacteraceae bacterium]